jgi:glycosyltransferase involved in cell wall biosynthesis
VSKGLVSVVIPVLNGEKYILECLRSVLSQELGGYELEVIVFDNNSVDGTVSIVRALGDVRISLRHSSDMVSAPDNWNRVSVLANGDFVKLLPADDTILSGCLLEQINALEAYTKASMVCSSRIVVSEKGKRLPLLLGALPYQGFIDGQVVSRDLVRRGRSLGEPGAVMFRGTDFRKNLPWKSTEGYAIDMDFYFRILEDSGFVAIKAPHATFRLSPDSWSNRVSSQQFSDVFNLYLKRLNLFNSNISIVNRISLIAKLKVYTFLRRALNFLAQVIDKLPEHTWGGKVMK